MPPPHHCFAIEDEMLPQLRSSGLTGVFKIDGKSIVVSEKVQVGIIIPDLIFSFSQTPQSIPSSNKRLSHFDCAVLSEIIRNGPSTIRFLCAGLYTSPDRVRMAIKTLNKSGFVRVSKNSVSAIKSRLPKVKIISVEAKLTRWKDALSQAVEYLHFSNCAYVAMPKAIVEKQPTIAISCKLAGIGLLSVDKTEVSMVVKGKSRNVKTGKWLWAAQKMVTSNLT